MSPDHTVATPEVDEAAGRARSQSAVHWRSRLGVAAAVFLGIGVLNLFAGLLVPTALHLGGPAAAGGLVLGNEPDGRFLGRSLEAVNTVDPAMGTFLVTFMDTMCAFMIAFAILQIGLAWFAVRRGQAWALWSSLTANLAIVPYYVAIGATFSQRGVPVLAEILAFPVGPAVIAVIATLIGWTGLRQTTRSTATGS